MLRALIFIPLALYFVFDYTTSYDRHFLHSMAGSENRHAAETFIQALQGDRGSLFIHSLARSMLFIFAADLCMAFYFSKRTRGWLLLSVIGVLTYADIIGIDLHYLNSDNYKAVSPVSATAGPTASTPASPSSSSSDSQMAATIDTPTPEKADSLILKDTSYYRVFDLRYGPDYTLTYGASTAWFHRSIGGYNAAKLSIYQDLISHQLSHYPHCQPVLNMLNTRWLIQTGSNGSNGDTAVLNKDALGPVWLVKAITYAPTAKEVMEKLTTLDTKDTAILFRTDSSQVNYSSMDDPQDTIRLTLNNNDEMVYQSSTKHSRFAVFSEIYYPRGWKAFIDGSATPIFRTNYALRGISIPAGEHTIRLIFHPSSYYIGQIVQRTAGWLILLLSITMIYIKVKNLFKPKTA